MYRPSMYNKHDETMLKFVEKFNGRFGLQKYRNAPKQS